MFRFGSHTQLSPEEIKNPPFNISYKLSKQIEATRSKFDENRDSAIELRDGGYISLVKSVSHYLKKMKDAEEARFTKEI